MTKSEDENGDRKVLRDLSDLKLQDFGFETPKNKVEDAKAPSPSPPPTKSNADLLREGDKSYSFARFERRDKQRARKDGHTASKQGSALCREYEVQLCDLIAAFREDRRRDKAGVWEAIKDIPRLELCMLYLGVTAAMDVKRIGVDNGDPKNFRPSGTKSFRGVALWIGEQFIQWNDTLKDQVEVQYRIGGWCCDRLLEIEDVSTSLPVFGVGEYDELIWLGMRDQEAFVRAVIESGAARNPYILPTAEEPKAWAGVWDGGTTSETSWTSVPLVADRASQVEVDKAIKDGRMPGVLSAINSLQRVPFVINQPVLDVASQREPLVPERPTWLPKSAKGWMRRKTLEKDARERLTDEALIKTEVDARLAELRAYRKAESEKAAWDMDMVTGNMLADRGRFWVPLFLDFRGRMYGIPVFNFQREDHIRGLFLFADGEIIGEEGLIALKCHVAGAADGNNWGDTKKPSKLLPENRLAWVDENMASLHAVGKAVERGEVPEGIESISDPVQFMAACYELMRAIEVGSDKFVTHLPLKYDASCSGMQHLCGMTRSEDGGLVNLTPLSHNGGPSDLYRDVADLANVLFTKRWYVKFNVMDEAGQLVKKGLDAFETKEEADRCASEVSATGKHPRFFLPKPKRPATVEVAETGYINVEIDRDLAKTPVMSYFYSSTLYGMTQQVAKFLRDNKKSGTGASKIAAAIREALEDVPPDAKAVRIFLEQLAEIRAQHNKLLQWTTPLGWPVLNLALKPEVDTIHFQFRGHHKETVLAVGDSDTVDKDAAISSVTANFTHSMDACHLMMVADWVGRERFDMAAIHDCFACLAPRVKGFNKMIRGAFFSLYEFNNVLEHLRLSVKSATPGVTIPDTPKFGNLNLKQIKDNPNTFAFN